MTQQPFSRPGAIDLSGLGQPAPQAGAPTGRPAAQGGGGASYSVVVDEQSFQGLLEQSMTAPVLLVFYSRTRMPESGQLADDLATVVEEHEGRYLLGLVDIDAAPQIAQAMQIPQIPLVVAVVDGRPMPLLQDPLPIEELRTALTQVGQQLTAQGITGRHQPRSGGAPAAEGEEEVVDPRYAPAQDALAAAKVMQRTQGVDLNAARAAAAEDPDDVDAQTMVADLDMLGGHVEDAFTRLVNLVARTSDKDREKARDHLLGLFAAVGNDDPRVLAGRRNLASALF
jgi:putative thioredoxin